MNNLTVGKKLALGFGAVVLVLCAIGILSSIVMSRASAVMNDIAQAYIPEMQVATAFEREILNARIQFIYHVTIQKPGALEAGWKRFRNARGLLPQLQTMAEASQLRTLRQPTRLLAADLDTYESELKEILECVATGQNHGGKFSAILTEWAERGGKLVATAALLNRTAASLADRESRTRAVETHQAVRSVTVTCILAVLLGVVIASLLTRNISSALKHAVQRLGQAVDILATSSHEVSVASQSLAAGATEQAASIQQTSASCHEISSMIARSSDSAHSMTAKLVTTERASASGMQALERMIVATDEVSAASSAVAKIIKVIDEIAFQTNLLALNAAVEAARAGSVGAGFAIVANEVRSLAQRSADAARQTSDLVGRSVASTADSRLHVDQVAATIRTIVSHAGSTREMAEGVSSAASEQTEGIRQIAKAISEIESVTQTVAGSAEQTAAAAIGIAGQAESMRDVAGELAALVG